MEWLIWIVIIGLILLTGFVIWGVFFDFRGWHK